MSPPNMGPFEPKAGASMEDGQTFWPTSSEQPVAREPRLVFDAGDRARMLDDPELSSYAFITQAQVAGLLWACGEYFRRTMWSPERLHPDSPIDVLNPEVLEPHGVLRRAYADIRHESVEGEAADAVFTAPEQYELWHHKWVSRTEQVTRDELVRLLRALHRYATRARQLDLFQLRDGKAVPFKSRLMFAHNVLVDFRANPLTLEQFARQIASVIASMNGHIGPSGSAK